MVQWKVKRKTKWRKKLLETPGLEPGISRLEVKCVYRYTKTSPIAITRKREMEFWNLTLQVNMSMIPASDRKINDTLVIAYCLSYNILESQRKQS